MWFRRPRARRSAATQAHLDALWAQSPVGVFQTDARGRCISVNPKWCELTGLAPADAYGEGWLQAVHPDDRERLTFDWTGAALGGVELATDFRYRRPDGSVVLVSAHARALCDPDGSLLGFLGTVSDMTEQREAERARARSEHDRGLAEAALRESEEMFRTLAVTIPVGVAHRDAAGSLTFINAEFRSILGIGADAPVDSVDMAVVHPDDRDMLADAMGSTLAGGASYEHQVRLMRPTGEARWVVLRGASHVDDTGAVAGYVVTGVDVTDRHLAEEGLRHSEEQFRVAFEQAPIGIGVIGMHGRFDRVNDAFTTITGYTATEMCGHAPYTIVAGPDKAEARERFQSLLARETDMATMQFRMAHKDGHEIWTEARINLIVGEDGKPNEILMQVQDVSERRQYEQRLRHLAHHDPLTGLVNRRGLERELDLQLARVRRYDTGGALLMLDLDGFKAVNDQHGHAVGDALLVGVAGALVERLRETDVVARLGGDEFAVILPGETPAQARIVAQALVDSVTTASEPFGTDAPVTVSIGLVALSDEISAADAMVFADQAMYRAKQAGKNRFASYREPDADPDARDPLRTTPGGGADPGGLQAHGARAA